MRFISWNVNGLRAAWNHGLSTFLQNCDADIYAFQETKVNEPFLFAELDGYEAYWSYCDEKRGYSGTLVLTKYTPKSVDYGIGNPDFDTEGRIITLEFDSFYFVNCYFPNSQRTRMRKDYRAYWDEALKKYLVGLNHKKPVIVGGDFNVPISDNDIYDESSWQEANAEGFRSDERENLMELLNNGFVDSYRLLYPDERNKFTWWSNRLNKRKENRGWRLDYFIVSEALKNIVRESTMLTNIYGSDHCPIFLDINLSTKAEHPVQTPMPTRYKYKDLLFMEERHMSFDSIKYSDLTGLWKSINWKKAEEHLQIMQLALAKSAYTEKPDLIIKWQKKIVYSIDAKVLAVRHVCSTAAGSGVDNIKWTTPHEKMSAALSLNSKGYHALPSRLLLIKGKNGKERRIHVETYYDRAMQTLYSYALDPIAESWGDRKSFAYRKGRSQYDMNEYIISAFSGDNAPEWAFIADVKKCYENISQDWIIKHIPMAEGVLREFLGAGYVFAGELFPTDVGIGIGCAISPIIANMVLDGLQDYIYYRLYPSDDDIDYANGNMLRYADDIIVAVRSESEAKKVRRIIRDFLDMRGLELSEEKSRIINIKDGFTFMSRTYEKRENKLYARPSDEACERFMTTIRETIEGYTGSQKSLIQKINRKIDGWVTYHKVSEASDAFRKMDVYISALLLQLCEQKHPKWTREKILEKYWYVDYEGRHCYALTDKKEIRVKFMADSLFYPYNPVKTNLNPYIEFDYMEGRTAERQILSVTGIYRSIWNRQNGKCYYCGRSILRDEEKALVDVDATQRGTVKRKAYIHKRCMEASFDYIDSESLPSSLDEVMELLLQLEEERKPVGQKYYALSEFFRTCDKNSVTLTFKQIEEIMGEPLGASALRKEYWYRTGFMNISQCWLDNGYEIKALHLEDRKRVVFHITSDNKNTSAVDIPEVLKYQRIPNEAKYELENYFQYIIKKYGL